MQGPKKKISTDHYVIFIQCMPPSLLYVDLPSVELIASSNNERSLPGMVLNTKKPIVYKDQFGQCHRLECSMQSIADNFATTYSSKFINGGLEDGLDTFLVYNKRRRVTSSAKRKRKHLEKSLRQTPDGALLDILRNAYDILFQCDIKLPEIEGNDKYVDSGPPYLIFLHPALGPLWEVTRRKFKGGYISKGSELQIEVAEFMWKNVELDGSLIIVADNVVGSTKACRTEDPELHYGHRCARCKLDNVKVQNLGIDWEFLSNVYWKHDVERCGECKVILHGNAEFEAKGVVLQGNHLFEVPDGYKMKITSGNPVDLKVCWFSSVECVRDSDSVQCTMLFFAGFTMRCNHEVMWERQHELAADKIYAMWYDLGGFFLKILLNCRMVVGFQFQL